MYSPGWKIKYLGGVCLSVLILSISSTTSSSAILTATGQTSPSSTAVNTAVDSELFPEPEAIKPRVDFWVDIYTRYHSREALIHDSNNLDIVYEVVDLDVELSPTASRRAKNRFLAKRKKHYSKILRRLGRQKGKCANIEECLVAALFAHDDGKSRFYKAARGVRMQQGLADRFLEGIELSGRYMDEMRRIFAAKKLPMELLALPHVESSFNVNAYSKYGAAGIWQFTRSTGRRFLKINYSYDERLDPIKSTVAAARLLKKNHETLESWPLAITAYNHGLSGIRRAKKRHGGDMVEIIEKYKRRTFGFASKNFYAEFLAAVRIIKNPDKYFEQITFQQPLAYDSVILRDYIPARVLTSHFNYDKIELAALNPSLRRPVWNGSRRIPKGYELKLPEGHTDRFVRLYEKIPAGQLHKGQIRQKWYYVKRGDALSTIARKFRTTISSIQDLNGIDNRHRIYSGQKLQIPSNGYRPKIVKANLELNGEIKKPEQVALVKKEVSLKKDVTPVSKLPAPESRTASLEIEPVETVQINGTFLEALPFSDYSLESRTDEYGIIRVRPEETIGHYSYWSGVSVTKILRLNGWSRRKPIHLGQKVKVPLSRVTPEKFQNRRYEYHLSLFEDFFSTYSVKKLDIVVVQKGQSLWTICNDDYDIPVWLVHLYNQGAPLDNLQPGQVLNVPVVGQKES